MKLQTKQAHMRGSSVILNGEEYLVDAQLCIEVHDQDDIQKALLCGFTDKVKLQVGPAGMRAGKPVVPPPSLLSARGFLELCVAQPDIAAQAGACGTSRELLELANSLGYNFSRADLKRAQEVKARQLNVNKGPQSLVDLEQAGEPNAAAAAPAPAVEADEVGTPLGSYSRKALTAAAEASGFSEAEILIMAYRLDMDGEQAGFFDDGAFGVACSELQAAAAGEKAPDLPALLPDGTPSEEWPEPTPEMSIDYLKQMADAYEVRYSANIGAQTLCERILAAMFPPDAS